MRVGPFDLEARVGIGGGGEVWRGVHRRQNVPVAVKLITGDRARDPLYRDAFQREVRSVAGLSHPGVVQVLDTGVGGGSFDGSPYLAMELAQGSLRDRPGPGSFEELHLWLLWLLDILAHAHAHGVVHRDLKPGNVLWFDEPAIPGDADGASRLRLADFGLAHAMDGVDVSRGTAGTPTFMAPEQFRGRWRDFGPATDLYALGCMAFALASGRPPFHSSDVTELMNAHLGVEPPPLVARFPVPVGFEAWLNRAMQKAPHHRFQRAADAAHALLTLGTVEGVAAGAPLIGGRHLPSLGETLSASATSHDTRDRSTQDVTHRTTRNETDNTRTERTLEVASAVAAPVDEPIRGEVLPRRSPPLPGSPRTLPRRPSLALVGAGLGLFGLRAVPLVGRVTETQAIWSHLAAVDEGHTRAVVLTGRAGAGKSRLADWIATRAQAAGAAYVARALHDPGGGPTHGLRRMLTGVIGGAGLSGDDLRKRIADWGSVRAIDPLDQRALYELLQTSGDAPTASERLALTMRVLQAAASAELDGDTRPLVLMLDDVQWGEDALELVSWALERDLPALFVCTVQEEALVERPVERERLESLQALPGVHLLTIGPLSKDARGVLVQELLLLEGDLARQVEERTAGIPLFAVQLVGDWVRRGLLEIGRTGFVLREGESAPIPDGIHELWVQRLARTFPQGNEALELAAVLGTEVDRQEWQAAARIAGVRIDGLARVEGLLSVTAESFRFVHGMLRESLERSARDAGRFERLHAAAATALQIRWEASPGRGAAERIGRHFLLAGDADQALEPLLIAARERRAVSDYDGALGVLDRRKHAMDGLGVGEQDPRRGQEWVARADVLICQGELERAEAEANKVVRVGRREHWESLIGPALRHAAVAVGKRGQLVAADRRLARAVEAARYGGDEVELARCILFQGDVARAQGEMEVAVGHYRAALSRFRAANDGRGEGLALLGLAGVHAAMQQHEQAERYCRNALQCFERRGARFAVASAAVALGDLHRWQGRYDEAFASYSDAERGMRALGSVEVQVVRLNQGLLMLDRGRPGEARDRLRAMLEPLRGSKRISLLAVCEAALVRALVQLDNARAASHHLRILAGLLERSAIAERDIINNLEGLELPENADLLRVTLAVQRRRLGG